LSPELRLRRQDVLSAWSGIRPLAIDPHASSTAAASRDHVVSYNPTSGVVFVSGGKWTTFREMYVSKLPLCLFSLLCLCSFGFLIQWICTLFLYLWCNL
jgi:glycerol-3-phosphate dehydrogenase